MVKLTPRRHLRLMARVGYMARGLVYLVVGGLALLAVFGRPSGTTTDSRGALVTIMQQPLGHGLLFTVFVGLICFSLWRFLQTVADPDGHGKSPAGLIVRAALLVSGLTHGALALYAIGLLVGPQAGGQSGRWTQMLIQTAGGQWALGLIGAAVVASGLAQIGKGGTARFERYLMLPERRWTRPLCRFGLIARGLVWCMIGWFLIRSAHYAAVGEARGMAQALEGLRGADYGPWLLAVVAAGLFAFGVYSMLEGFYRRIDWR